MKVYRAKRRLGGFIRFKAYAAYRFSGLRDWRFEFFVPAERGGGFMVRLGSPFPNPASLKRTPTIRTGVWGSLNVKSPPR